MRKYIKVKHAGPGFQTGLQNVASGFETACILSSNRDRYTSTDPYSCFEICAALGSVTELKNGFPAFENLKEFHDRTRDWLFCFLTYDLKNEIEKLESANPDGLGFPTIHFFQPRYLFLKMKNEWQVGFLENIDSEESVSKLISEINSKASPPDDNDRSIDVHARVTREEYIRNVNRIKEHIQRGDIYEMNYCVEFFASNQLVNIGDINFRLNEISPMPFSSYYKCQDHYLVCASPERFIAKRGRKIISQPIKGTAKRGANPEEDEIIRSALRNNEKEQSENVMIVDLVRNDLSRTASKGSVAVEELFGIQTFRQLHQMTSTIVSEAREGIHWTEVIRNTFPMGSMTGAPKIRAMQLIEEYESTRRGLYSGTVGYVTPEGDFDFNVVIRSILYNKLNHYLSFMVGSAITILSDPEKEYEECMLKARSMIQCLTKHGDFR